METDNTADSSGDPDPIIASYKVYANPALSRNRKLLIMQHPNKQGPVNQPYVQVDEVRIKNKSGMIEVDVPISHAHGDYDRDKGQRWGGALAKSSAAKNGGTQGLAGGFGVGVSTLRPSKRRDEFERDIDMLDWSEAVRQDRVLRTQTLGGQLPPDHETECRWMVGVFKGNKLHLTPASALIQLRPQLHHIDAMAEQERASRQGASAAGKEGAPATASGAGARAIHMSIKSADSGGGELTTETMADRLRTVQTEAWGKLKYEDEESLSSWTVFSNNLIYRSAKEDKKAESKIDDAKGKEKQQTNVIVVDSSSDSEQLESRWNEHDLLKAISGMKDGPEGSQQSQQEGQQQHTSRGASSVEVKKEGGTATKTPNTKGKSVTFKRTDKMDID